MLPIIKLQSDYSKRTKRYLDPAEDPTMVKINVTRVPRKRSSRKRLTSQELVEDM